MNSQDNNESIVSENPSDQKPTKPKKKHRFIKGLLIFIIIVAGIIVTLGFVLPGLLWSKDLGVKYSRADYESALNKLDYIKDDTPAGDSESDYIYTYSGLKDVSTKFSSEEITAFINTDRPSYYAVKNVQVRVNADGSVEASGTVNVDYILDELLSGKFSREQILEEIPALGLLPSSVNLYVKTSGSVVGNAASVAVDSVQVQGISIPSQFVNSTEATSTVNSGLNSIIGKYGTKSGSVFEKVAAENGKLVVEGKFPSSLERKLK